MHAINLTSGHIKNNHAPCASVSSIQTEYIAAVTFFSQQVVALF